ncbi:HD domain-containing protein [Hydrogenoanaerobacterium saccharovorans]|uniref:HD domain-containing protein n=1 Tax=Hydrogenoanaerobacterium saccharovorans TaxID=474960 RepID=A0A1H8AQK0_9FIRM|nr:HD-GYP domain-containing protein [Hydrogenoanaerobacterium saccharovorans]RPF47809.1 HD domain-containing protein [Hydrogenoanaerobacterium saccharovorans]SEM72843.1 HD domain-containing protein [Hydrogenoanaerobacterium saccharovorans]
MERQLFNTANEYENNRLLARCMLLGIPSIFIIWLLNQLGFFAIDKVVMAVSSLISVALLSMPVIITDCFKISGWWVKYVLILLQIIVAGLLYSLLTYLVLLLFVFPLFTASLYFNRHLILYAFIVTGTTMIVSHLIGLKLHFMPDKPLTTFQEAFFYGIIPLIVLLSGLCFIALNLVEKNSKILHNIFCYSRELQRSHHGLESIFEQCQPLFETRSFYELSRLIIRAVFNVTATIKKNYSNQGASVYYLCVRYEPDLFYVIDKLSAKPRSEMHKTQYYVQSGEKQFLVDIQNNPCPSAWIEITSDTAIMRFYDDKGLTAYLMFQLSVNIKDSITHNLMQAFYNNIQLALRNTQLTQDMIAAQEELVRAFAEITENKSRDTGNHVKRVSEYVKILAYASGMNETDCVNLSIASMMHDVGKILIPKEILEKPASLTPEEFEAVKTHVLIGSELLKNSPGDIMQLARTIALEHHEKWNGEGYLKKQGEQISYSSRLVAVADVFDALMSRRPYKEPWPLEDAYNEIVAQSGKHFDPAVVCLFQNNFEKFVQVAKKYCD